MHRRSITLPAHRRRHTVHLALALASAVLLTLGSCSSDDEARLDWVGQPGTPTPATIITDVPVVDLAVDGAAPGPFLVDTGAPATVLDAAANQLPVGVHRPATLEVLGITVRGLEVGVLDLFGGVTQLRGILGGDVLRHFALTVDYQGGLTYLWHDLGGSPPPLPSVGPAAHDEPFTLTGGGILPLGSTFLAVGATRIVLGVGIEGQSYRAVLDTGASTNVLSGDVYRALLAAQPGRPTLSGLQVVTIEGVRTGVLTRLADVAVGDTFVTSIPAMHVPGSAAFDALTDEIGERIDLLLGGSFLREFRLTIDYPSRRLHLERYQDPSHIDRAEYVTVGLTYDAPVADTVVQTVFDGTDAQAQGVQPGWVILRANGRDVTTGGPAAVKAAVDASALGDAVPFRFHDGTTTRDLTIQIEDLLPDFP